MNNITVIGIGKLGICNALCLEQSGYNVVGVDTFPEYVDSINNKTYRSYESFVNEYLDKAVNFRATTSLKEGLDFSDVIYIIVPTPNGGGERFYDHSILNNLLCRINSYKVKNKHIIICCTVMPRYIQQVGKLLISDCENCTLNYNPEFIAQGEIIHGYHNPDIVLIGEETKEAGDIIEALYKRICHNQPRMCRMAPLDAEITKISINGFITTKIAYANLISDICDTLGANKYTVTKAIGGDSRIGNKYFNPGYAYGGPCFPRDTKALSKLIDSIGLKPVLPMATHQQNELHNEFQAEELLRQNNESYTIENVCYKANSQIPMIEESAKLKIAQILHNHGKKVIINDNKHVLDEVKKDYGNIFEYVEK